LQESNLPLLAEWLRRPHVVEWWAGDDAAPSLEDVRRKYLPRLDEGASVTCYLAYEGDELIGFAQSYVALGCGDGWWEDETDPGVRGIDQFLADASRLGQGLGTRMVRAFVERLLSDPEVTKVQTDPDPTNARAIRCYEKAGFRPVGGIVTPDGPALLMVIEKTPRACG
jgi:aminoglycoside 6'-N-acetyltransferase-1b